MGDQDRDSIVGVSEDEAIHDDDESDSENGLRESITDYGPESSMGDDCLTCSDTKEAAVRSACKRFCKKVQALCSPGKQGIWKDTELEQIKNNCNIVWGSDYEVIKTKWDLTLDRDPNSLEVWEMMVCTDELFQIKVAINVRNIYPQEHKVDFDGREKALVQLLKQFHACYYQLYEKGMTHAMMGLQGLHSSDTHKCPHISAGVGLNSFCPWCLKLGRNTETITIHLHEVHYWMVNVCDICQVFAGMTMQSMWDHQPECKGKCDKEHAKCNACEVWGKVPKSHKLKKIIQVEIKLSRILLNVFLHSYSPQ